MSDYEKIRDDLDRMKGTDMENRQLKDIRRDYEVRITTLEARNSDLERTIIGLKQQVHDNDNLMNKFAEEIRLMDVEIDRK